MQKIILYYKFAPLDDPAAMRLWQRTLCESLNLRGRILIAPHGINGTLAGELDDLKQYIKATRGYAAFKGMEFKWSDGSRDDFPKLSVKVRSEVVTFGVPDEIKVNASGVIGAGTHLKPQELHALLAERGDDVQFFDGRNAYEAAVGRFKGAVVTGVEHTRDFVHELDKPEYEVLKTKPVVTYCTGGIRCEILSMLMKKRGFQEVYQLDGGIQKYGETYGDNGLWEGSLYVFDGRMGHKFSDAAKDIGGCIYCQARTSTYDNCTNQQCNQLMLVCASCADRGLCPTCLAAMITP